MPIAQEALSIIGGNGQAYPLHEEGPAPKPRLKGKRRISPDRITDLIAKAVAVPSAPAVIVRHIKVQFADVVLPRERELLRRVKVTAATRRAKALGATLLEVVSLFERL
jgi:hypothetical protein